MKVPRKIKKKIPKGMYCYKATSGIIYPECGGLPYYKIKKCPYFEFKKDSEGHKMGCCKLLKVEDDLGLNDQCKICEVNMGRDSK